MYEPYWVSWDPSKEGKWVKAMPTYDCVINSENNPFLECGWRDHMRPSQFYSVFSTYIAKTTERSVALIGIRSDESLNRYRALFANKEKIEGHNWTTRLGRKGHMFNAYPIYDFRVEDIWGYQSLCGQPYNKVYDQMLLAGKTVAQMRICQPFGDEQKAGLDLYAQIEPDTWARIVERCSAANMGSLYRGSKFLGVGGITLPEGFNWKTYYHYILTTLPGDLREHYERMTGVTVENWIKKGKIRPTDGSIIKSWEDIDPDFGDCAPGAPSYKRFCKMILSGDFMGHTLKFGGRKHEYTNFEEGVHANRKKPAKLATQGTQQNPLKAKYEQV
jgi:predicted phosphoadenosine phosphosulfate sulfurtransferase